MTEKDKKLEDFIEKLMSNDVLETPSDNFTNTILSQLEAKKQSVKIEYKPLIPKSIWLIITMVVFGVIGYVYLKQPVMDSAILDKINELNVLKNSFADVNFNLSETSMYAFVLLALMLCIQIPILKNYFNKRMQF